MNLPVFSACVLLIYISQAATPASAQQDPPTRPVRVPNPGNAENSAEDAEEAGKKAREVLEQKSLAFLDRLISDSASFSLDENRIYVKAKAVEILWKLNEARARTLAREVMGQIIANYSDTTERQDLFSSRERIAGRSGNLSNLRNQLVTFLSSVDSRFALEFLRATQHPATARMGGNAEQEKYIEYQLAARAVQNDPQMSFQMAQDLLKTGLNYQVFPILNNLRAKDPELGAKLESDIIEKIKSADLLASYENINSMNHMLQNLRARVNQAAKAAVPAPDVQQSYRELLNYYVGTVAKLTPKTMLNPQARNLLRNIGAYLPEVENHLPARVAALRVKLNEFNDTIYNSPQEGYFQEYSQKVQNKSSQELMSMASTAPQEVREYVYQQAANKALEQGDKETARKISREHLSDQSYADQLIAGKEREAAERVAGEGKYDEALSLLAQFNLTEQERANTLARWASAAMNRSDETTARRFLDEARGIVSGKMQTRQQIETQIALASSYLKLEPEISFGLVETIIERLNEVIAAQIVLTSYNDGGEGESFIASGEISYANSVNLNSIGPELMRKDFDRTVSTLERWQLKEARILVSLGIIQNLLNNPGGIQFIRRRTGEPGEPRFPRLRD
jgi:hypothetical protein